MDDGDLISLVALLTIAVITVIGNILVILAVLSNRRLQNPANYLMVNLAVSDFFQGAVSMPLRAAELLNTSNDNLIRCDVVISIAIFFHVAANFNLALIALDRFIAVFKPFAYSNVVKTSSYKIAIPISWLCSLIISGCPVVGWRRYIPPEEGGSVCRYGTTLTDEYLIMYIILVDLSPLVIMLVTYGYIFRTTRRQIRQIRAQEIAVNHAAINQAFDCRRTSQTNNELSQSAADASRVGPIYPAIHSEPSSTAETVNNTNNNNQTNGKRTVTKQDSNSRQVPLSTTRSRKATRTVLAIIGFFIVLCMPITIIDAIELWCKPCGSVPRAVIIIALCMSASNSCVNVFVYGGYNTDYRKAYWNVWHRVKNAFVTRTKNTVQSVPPPSTCTQ